MPTSGRPTSPLLVDTSVAVALTVVGHSAHDSAVEAFRGERLGLAGHANFETYSVLTRLPGASRRPSAEIVDLIRRNFPEPRYLDAGDTARLWADLTGLGISGGAVYDALVGAAAALHGLTLATFDRRAMDVYRVLNVDVLLIE